MIRRLVSLCLCVFVLSVNVWASEDTPVRLPPFSKFQLKNGMTLLLMEQHEVPIISFSVIVKDAGSIADPKGKEGAASLAADLLRKGTHTRTADDISGALDFIGGEFDMNASLDFTSGSAEFMKKDLRQGLGLMADMLLNPLFPESEITKLVKQRIDGIKSAKDDAQNVIGRYFNAYLFGQHPYARPVNGDELSLPTITRRDIQRFYEERYLPSNVILAVAGDFAIAEMKSLLEQRFDFWASGMQVQRDYPAPSPAQGKRLLLVDKPDATQTYFYVGNLGVARTNPDRVPISVINTLFGGRFTSKLNTALRIDSGLTYGAHSMFDQRRLPGPFMITSYTKNTTTEQALDMTLDVLKSFHQKGITQAELDSAKAYLKGQFPPSIETTDRLASIIARLEFYGLDESDINSYYAKVDAITLADSRRIIDKYFPQDNLVFVLIGKANEIQTIARKYAPVVDRKSITQPGF